MASQRGKDAAGAKSKPLATTSSTAAAATTATSTTSTTTTATPASSSSSSSSATATAAVATASTASATAKSSRASERGKPAASSGTTTTSTSTTSASGSGTSSNAVTSTSASSSTTMATTTSTSGATSASATSTTAATAPATTSGGAPASDVATTTTATATTTGGSSSKQRASASAATSSASSSPTENVPPVDLSQCALCGGEGSSSPDEMMACLCCGCSFHARCANLPQTPEEGDTFCRWECFSAFRKRQGAAPKTPLGDFSKLAARVQSILVHNGPLAHGAATSGAAPAREKDQQRTRMRERGKRSLQGAPNGRSRSPSPFLAHNEGSERVPAGPPHNGYGAERRLPDEIGPGPRRPSPRGRSPVQPRHYSPHVDLTMDDVEMPPPRSPRSRPAARGIGGRVPMDDMPLDEAEELRSKRQKYLTRDDPMGNGARGGPAASRRDSYPPPPSRRQPSPLGNGAGDYPNDVPPHYVASGAGAAAGMDAMKGGDPRQGFPPGPYDQRGLPPGSGGRGSMAPTQGPVSSRMPPVDDELGSRPSSGRSARPGSGSTRYSDRVDEYDSRGPPPGPPRSRPTSADRPVEGSGGRRGRVPADGPPANKHVQQTAPPGRLNIPWLNPAAFPSGLHERFNCRRDDGNGVFRIDLSPVFADKTMHLYQSEIDFFFRCFESADVSLVVKGMASELNQYIWAWPFILESCGSETHFSFDHFQFRHNAGELPELEYVGELRLSMAAYNAYLERYLSGSMANDVVVLEDHATKKPITLVAGENIIALNDLVIAEHCAQLYNDLIKSFQWDVFAGGIHCLLQYLPQANRHKRFASPLLHFNFPGARGRLRDPGNGTTDTAYQVLTGSLELVIFERLEPKDRDTFLRVLRAAGYDASKKTMLLDSHLRILRDSGFAWSTVLLNGGEFVHVNKGRLHFWRVVESEGVRGPMVNAPCVFLSWEWVYQGVSQRGISTECWFAMKNASLCTGGWAFDPRRAIVEAAKCGVAIVRTGQFLNSLSGPGAPPVLMQLAFTGASPASIDREVVSQRQEQMVLFLESILPCMDAIVEEEFELGLVKDDSDDFRKVFDDEIMWKVVDTALSTRATLRDADYDCGICGLELTNIYKQCLGCTVHARRRRPNAAYPVFRICLRCHAQPERHHFKPRALHGFYDKLCSSEGHTGLLPATRRYQAERSYFKCRCAPYVRCGDCGGCESCCCLCHTLFQTRFRFTAPEHLDHLRTDVVDVIKWHKQQQLPPPHLQRPHPHAQR